MKRLAVICILFFALVANAATLLGWNQAGESVAPIDAAQFARGQAGSSRTGQGWSALNPARQGWDDKAQFQANTLVEGYRSSEDGLALSGSGFVLSTVNMSVAMGLLGGAGIGLWQRSLVDVKQEISDSAGTVVSKVQAKGGVFELVPTWGLRLPFGSRRLAVGASMHMVFGKQSTQLDLRNEGSDWLVDQFLVSDKVESRYSLADGAPFYLGYSMHYKAKRWDAFGSYTMPHTIRRNDVQSMFLSATDTLAADRSLQDMDFPAKIATGVTMRFSKTQSVSLEFVNESFQNDISSLATMHSLDADASTQAARLLGIGWQYDGSGFFYDRFFKRNSYRLGVWQKDWYLRDVREFGSGAGIGLPLGRRGAKIDLGIYGGLRQAGSSGWDETFWGLSAGLTGTASWGQSSRRNR